MNPKLEARFFDDQGKKAKIPDTTYQVEYLWWLENRVVELEEQADKVKSRSKANITLCSCRKRSYTFNICPDCGECFV